jgi:hypothetical protein
MVRRWIPLILLAITISLRAEELGTPLPALPDRAKLLLDEDWSSGKIDPARWYSPRRKWNNGNAGVVPALWTYAYRPNGAPRGRGGFARGEFLPDRPLFNPFIGNAYWSEIDFPEFGRDGRFDQVLYNTFLQNKHDPKRYIVHGPADGQYHTFTTDWRTRLVPLDNVTDAQVKQAEGYWWIHDKSIPYESYYGNPLKKLGKDRYALYTGDRADHFIDGKKVAENTRYVPAMAAQLTMGIWLPDWAGPAPWQTSRVAFASVKVWSCNDEGDVTNILKDDCPDNFPNPAPPATIPNSP